MKNVRHLPVALLGLFVIASTAKADPSDDSPDSNPYTQYDADGVPLSVTQAQPRQPSPDEIKEAQQAQAKAEADKNWLLRAYEQQMQSHAANSSEDQSANVYYQISTNKELAKLAGVPLLDLDAGTSTPSYRTGEAQPGHSTAPLRSDSSSTSIAGPQARGFLLKPLITPLSEADAAGMHDFYSSLPTSSVAPFYGSTSPKPTAPAAAHPDDSSDIETPGMIAAENNTLLDTSATDMNANLDLLPGESVEQAKAHQDSANNLELPLPMDASQLHKTQAAALSAQTAPTTAKKQTSAPVPAQAAPTDDPDAPIPVSKVPQINPGRPAIANPYDILNR